MKITCIVQARMGSERLPGKVLKPVLSKPMIEYTLDRLKKSRYLDEIVLATSTKEADSALDGAAKNCGVKFFRGDEDFVLKRYVDAANEFGGDVIVRVTGDCPFIDPYILDHTISYFLAQDFDYVSNGVPDAMIRGFDTEVFSKKSLLKTYETVKDLVHEDSKPYKEHVTLYMYRHTHEFNCKRLDVSGLYKRDYRLCVDTKEDFELITAIYEHFKDTYVSAKDVVDFLDRHPEIAKINSDIEQKHI